MDGLEVEIRIPENVLFNEVAGEAVLLNLESGRYFALNEVGARLWRLLAEHGRLGPVLEQMLVEYEVTPEQLRADVEPLIEELLAQGLLVRGE